ncbi:MAG: asparagine synthase (glutamine-hydrolyzing), partial [Vicinamibacterales bacterium]
MCGIAGFVIPTSSSRSIDDSKLISMRDALSHRGPDEAGIHRDARVALLHRRLSIVDLTSGQQPMSNEDGSHWIVYNGEVYNHAEQRSDLEARGHHYRSHCDTETILHLYEEYGPAGIQHLRGMFAFAIWNSRKRELFIARDRLGVKPVYYAQAEDGTLWFASEIKALIAAGAVKPALRLSSLPEYLANHATCGEETLYEGVRRLLPGHHLTWIDGRTRIERYWDIPPQVAGPLASLAENDVVEQWGQLLETSVRLRLMADVPLGMFLSGGIDSSAIAALMSGMVSDPIKTFSVAFAEREANELEYARVVARAFQTDHHEVIVSADQFFQALPRLIWHEDEPLAHPSSVPLFFVSQLASRYVKVVLTGEGSDELLAGYYRYRKTILNLSVGRWYHRLVPSPARSAFRAGFGTLPHPVVDKLRRTFLWLPPDVSSLYFDNFAVFSTAMLGSLLSSDARARIGALQPHADLA